MILDMQAAFTFKQPITVTGSFSSAWTSGSPNAGFQGLGYIDIGAWDVFAMNTNTGTAKIGIGKPLYLVSLITTSMTDHTGTPSATIIATLQTADDSSFTSNLTTVLSQDVFAAATKAGTRRVNALPVDFLYRRYLRMLYTVANPPLTAGKISSFIVLDLSFAKTFYPQRSSIAAG